MQAVLLLNTVSEELPEGIQTLGGQLCVIGLEHLHSHSGKLILGSNSRLE